MAFREEDHPRDNDGKFTDQEGGKTYHQNISYDKILANDATAKTDEDIFVVINRGKTIMGE